MRRLLILILSADCLLFAPQRGILAADLTKPEQRQQTTIENLIRTAGRNYRDGKYDQAGDAVRKAMSELNAAAQSGSPELFDTLKPSIKRISRAHTLLEFEGVTLPPFRVPKRPEQKPAAAMQPAQDGVSFVSVVAPILAKRCGSCHIESAKGNFSMASYSVLMKGPPEGVVIFPGDVVGSRLIETIVSGDMPRGGGKVLPDELDTLKKWIADGARFDGSQPTAPISNVVASTQPSVVRPMVRQATGKETVSFARDVAPLLIENCKGCHLDSMRTRGGLRMDTFAQLIRGGDSGPLLTPGKGAESLLVQRLRGMSGDRMPAGGRPALSEDSIKLIAKWIDEGATLDGSSQSQPLQVMSQLAWATSATPDQVSQRRSELSLRNLKLAAPTATNFPQTETENFLVIGDVSPATIDLVASQAESHLKEIRNLLPTREKPLFRGRATIIVLPKRYAYSEFAKMIEQRTLPNDWLSHWKFDGIDAYVALVATDRDDEQAIADRIANPLTSLAVASQGGVPDWFAEGLGRAVSQTRNKRGDRNAAQQSEAALRSAISAVKNPKQFFDEQLTPQQTERIATALVASMLEGKRRRGFNQTMRKLSSGDAFEQAFVAGYGVSLSDYFNQWLASWR